MSDGVQQHRLSPTVPDMWRRAGRAEGGKPADEEACFLTFIWGKSEDWGNGPMVYRAVAPVTERGRRVCSSCVMTAIADPN